MTTSDHPTSARRRRIWPAGLLFVVALTALVARQPVHRALMSRWLLRSQAPSEDAFRELVDSSADPFPLLQRAWDTQKIPHRVLVATYLKEKAGQRPELIGRAHTLLLSAAADPDAAVRELALAVLSQQKHPALPGLAAALLGDADPQLRLLGIQYLRKQDAALALPAVFALLDDPDLQVVTSAESALRSWTKQDFGIRISQANFNLAGGGASAPVDPANLKTIHEGLRQWKEWWKVHQADYPTRGAAAAADPMPSPRLPAADFALPDLEGETVHLSDFRGKLVLLNFWTTWCPGCQAEIPDLVALQRSNPDELVVLGVSLDGQAEVDEHGHAVGGHGTAEETHGDHPSEPSLANIRATVSAFAKEKRVNYRLLLDPRSEVGERFNGGELPTNVLIDREGFVRRRFLGGRPQAVFQAMLDELTPGKAVGPGAKRLSAGP
jgi:peroxiredoxin